MRWCGVGLGLSCLAWAGGAQEEPPAPETVRPQHGEAAAPERFAWAEGLADTEELAVWLGDGKTPPGASLVLLDARTREEYQAGHLPGARNVESDALQDPERKPYYLPAPEVIAKLAVAAGITPEARVVVYDAHGGRLAARVWFTLWAYGHARVAILDGGLPKWQDERRALTLAPPPEPSRPGTWTPMAEPRGVCGFDGLKAYRARAEPGRLPPSSLLDARSYPEYTGADVRGPHGGHVPGAVNIPWDALLKPVTYRRPGAEPKGYWVWREPAEIHALLRAAGVIPDQPLAVYDQSGGRAAHLLFTLRLMGYTRAVSYVGGWREYGCRDDVEIER